MQKSKYKADNIRNYVCEILKKTGVPEDKAATTADVLVEADLRGICSHGVNNLDLLVLRSIREGGTDPYAVPVDKTLNMNFPIRLIDAKGDLGPSSAMAAVDTVKDLARKIGFGKVYVTNANHFGAAAVYSEKICTEKDLAGRVFCTTPSTVRPYGGRKTRLGTNLISWSIPYDRGTVTIDMATTIHAISGILKALKETTPLPFPVYDKDGKEISSASLFKGPDDFLKNGSMMPLGGIGKGGADAGYKGTGLAMLIELDSVLGGGISGWIDPLAHDRKRWVRQIFEAWRIDTLVPREQALKAVSHTIEDIKENQGKDMRLPGEKEALKRKESLREGILYTVKQIERLEKAGRDVGLGEICRED